MVPFRIGFLIRAIYDLLPSNANLVRLEMKDNPTRPLGPRQAEHVLNSCKIAHSHSRGRCKRQHSRVVQEFSTSMCEAKCLPVQPKARAIVFT
ncbi:Zinc-binding in reverse transcriptase domain-containing protein [Plakobranchus ocellatus]|uniref:Zinc-binding in reverse transcriptase domain-containing protein n=1 Tax=Plakobranchus ocellatus TaxID=259542 RepID=A0AAV4D2F7_9GAST|nr:Zinc-binding in reverse transcriptase domain-containing protein [Plakobranchus ocellatus]